MFDQQKNYLTKEGYEKLIAELHELKTQKLPAVLEELKDAQAHGDLSENFGYDMSKAEKEFIEGRIIEIEGMLKNVEIIEETTSKTKVVGFGSKVTLEDERGETEKVVIVGTGEAEYARSIDENNQADIDRSDYIMMSFDSPIGNSIRGHKSGDTVKVRLASGRQDMKIVDVK